MTAPPPVPLPALRVQGEGARTVLLLHGWPDTESLWDATVTALLPQCRCVRFTWPGFAADDPPQAHAVQALVALLHAVVQQVQPEGPVTLLLHDWGCVFGAHYAQAHPERVEALVVLDVGDAGSPAHVRALSAAQKWGIFSYQAGLALAWWVGARIHTGLGNRLARRIAAALRCPVPPAQVRAAMGYPYFIQWTGAHGAQGAYRGLHQLLPPVPTLFIYGTKKPFMFHSQAWADALAARAGCRVLALKAGHWLMLDQPAGFHGAVCDWLRGQDIEKAGAPYTPGP